MEQQIQNEQHFRHGQLEAFLRPITASSGSMATGEPERQLVYEDVMTQDGEKEAERLIMEAKKWTSASYPSNPAELMQVPAVSFYKEFGETHLTAQQLPSYTDLETVSVAIQHNLNNGDCVPAEDQRIVYDGSITSDKPRVPYNISAQQDSREDRPYHHKEVHGVDQTLHADNVGNKKEEKLCCIKKAKNDESDIEDASLETECMKDSSETDIEGSREDVPLQSKMKGKKTIKPRVSKVTETWEGDILDRGSRRRIQDRCSPRLSGKNKIVTVQTMGEIVLPANCKSPVWEYFSFQVSNVEGGHKMVSKNVSVCRLCKTHVRCMGNTTNMATHLKRHHPEVELLDGKEKDRKQTPPKSASKLVKRKTSPPLPPSPPLPLVAQEKQEKKSKKCQAPHKNSLSDLSIDGDVFDRWWRLGTEHSLDSDKEIASFLLHYYENSMKNVQSGSCQSCHAPITLLCAKCRLTFEAMPSQPAKTEEEKHKESTEFSDHEVAEVLDDRDVSSDEIPVKFEEHGTNRPTVLVKKPILLRSKRKFRKRPMHRRESVKVYRCGQCVAVFKHPKSLENHMQTHTGDRPFKCQECETAFKRSSDLAVHMRTHTGERPYKCDLCEAAFTQSCALSRHVRTHPGAVPVRRRKLKSTLAQVHVKGVSRGPKPKGPKVYNCDQCWKSFQSSSNLKVHMRIHTGERPYTCEVCGATFTQSSALSLHKRTHQLERPFKCDQCDGSFKRSSDLAIHMRTHTGERPYVCELCGSAFAQLSTLTIHRSSHSDNKPYKCRECGMMFKLTSHLQRHLKTHVGHVPCDQCGAMFKSAVALARHVRKHAGPDAVLLPADRFVNIGNL